MFRDCLERGEKIKNAEFRLKRSDGSQLMAEVTGSRFQAGSQDGTLVTIRDVTAKKLSEAEILNLNATLEQKIAKRTLQLSESNKNLEREIEVRQQAEAEGEEGRQADGIGQHGPVQRDRHAEFPDRTRAEILTERAEGHE